MGVGVGKRMQFGVGYCTQSRWGNRQGRGEMFGLWGEKVFVLECGRASPKKIREKIVREERSLFVQARSFCYIAEKYKEIS